MRRWSAPLLFANGIKQVFSWWGSFSVCLHKDNVVGTHYNRLSKGIIMNTQNVEKSFYPPSPQSFFILRTSLAWLKTKYFILKSYVYNYALLLNVFFCLSVFRGVASQPTRRRQCRLCGKQVLHSSLSNHMRIHSSDKYTCSVCQKTFSRKDVCQRHMLTVHIRPNINWATSWENLSSEVRDQVRLKPTCSARSYLEAWNLAGIVHNLGSEQWRHWSNCAFLVCMWHMTGFIMMWLS